MSPAIISIISGCAALGFTGSSFLQALVIRNIMHIKKGDVFIMFHFLCCHFYQVTGLIKGITFEQGVATPCSNFPGSKPLGSAGNLAQAR